MFRGRFTLFLLLIFPYLVNCNAKKHHDCDNPSSCGSINITYPFRLEGDPDSCGELYYVLACKNNDTLVLQKYWGMDWGKYNVQAINYNNKTIRVVDAGIQKSNCSSRPLYYLVDSFFSRSPRLYNASHTEPVTFVKCENPVRHPRYIDSTASCVNNNINGVTNSSNSSMSSEKPYSYVILGSITASDLLDSCTIDLMVLTSASEDYESNFSFIDIHNKLAYGFELSWDPIYRVNSGETFWERVPFWVQVLVTTLQLLAMSLGAHVAVKCVCCGPCVFTFLIYKWRRRHLSMFDTVEDFLRSHNNLMPIRYSFPHIKKMTNGLKEKLGEGGYGTVYKGKLRSGRAVAIKILGQSKANGQEFINEVATIGRIHHTNVAQLIGFCAERSKRALVYEFMPNGSLEKYIFPQEEENLPLSYEKMYKISLGVARGIEYLHQGCDMQILHFDIKPHNILLDENFNPKVSDFGLAKLYPTDNSIVPLTGARGTMGYMAPELFYKNIGGVSYKADVYSFGMLLMEMVGRRKNLNPFVEHSSQIYFPSWVYDQFNEREDIKLGGATEEESKIARKMVIVALWCIQLKPSDRPSMKKVVEMLEGNVEVLQMPPKPLLSPQEMRV